MPTENHTARDQQLSLEFPATKLCECGCGKPTRPARQTNRERGWIKGQPIHFLQGHGTRSQIVVRADGKPSWWERFWKKVDTHGPVPKCRPELGPCWLWI